MKVALKCKLDTEPWTPAKHVDIVYITKTKRRVSYNASHGRARPNINTGLEKRFEKFLQFKERKINLETKGFSDQSVQTVLQWYKYDLGKSQESYDDITTPSIYFCFPISSLTWENNIMQ